jgi:hypothetical protein
MTRRSDSLQAALGIQATTVTPAVAARAVVTVRRCCPDDAPVILAALGLDGAT